MTAKQLMDEIDTGMYDIEFEYKGVHGAICPFSRTNISIAYGDNEKTLDSVDAVMNEPFFNGKSLAEICSEIEFDY